MLRTHVLTMFNFRLAFKYYTCPAYAHSLLQVMTVRIHKSYALHIFSIIQFFLCRVYAVDVNMNQMCRQMMSNQPVICGVYMHMLSIDDAYAELLCYSEHMQGMCNI